MTGDFLVAYQTWGGSWEPKLEVGVRSEGGPGISESKATNKKTLCDTVGGIYGSPNSYGRIEKALMLQLYRGRKQKQKVDRDTYI